MNKKVTLINNKNNKINNNHPIFKLFHQMIYQDSNLNSSNNRNTQMMTKNSLNNNKNKNNKN